jgi:glucose/arabinose dehydrogenase
MDDPFSNHNGGQLQFGPDGDLYIGTGDGGSENDPNRYPQNLKSPLGKLLRLDVDKPSGGHPYGIPAGNPFAKGGRGLPILYAWGLRNPWRWSFDAKDGDIWIGDVGQDHYEEVDHVLKGKAVGGNFGWSRYEGKHVYDANRPLTGAGHLIAPVAEYSHDVGCSITGGYVYRGPSIPVRRLLQRTPVVARTRLGLAARRLRGREGRGPVVADRVRRRARRHAVRRVAGRHAVPLRRGLTVTALRKPYRRGTVS